MDFSLALAVAVLAAWMIKTKEQGERIALLARLLARYRIEAHIETLTQGYLRALGEADAPRREQVWALLRTAEDEVASQLAQLAADTGSADEQVARVSKLPIYAPFALSLFPSFDLREALRVHARGIQRAVQADPGGSQRDRAFTISAELLLLQHTCHWFCRSRAVASARLLRRHKTSYDQVLAAVLPETRKAYVALVS
ncbi:MAG TPA: hypothetical protein VEA40_01075 [Ramlibacter sp.]|nr:hypothetical protein [Ramlibacter sp.]